MRKKLKRRLRREHRKLRRTQSSKARVLELSKWAKKRKLEWLRKRVHNIAEKLTARARRTSGEIRRLEKELDRLEKLKGRAQFLKFVHDSVGATEYGALHKKMCDELGLPYSWPWCSIFVSYGLIKFGGFTKAELPSGPAYSGSWLTWSHGQRVSYSNAQPGDLIIYDWGDGGMTDHVEVYVGNGQGIGGNESDPSGGAVKGPSPVSVGNIVGVVRPNW